MKKFAAPPPPPPDNFISWAPGKATKAPISPVGKPNVNHVVSANIATKQMQSAIIDLYNSFKYYPMFNKDPNYRENNPQQYGESYEHGADSFMSFMMNRYVNKKQVPETANKQTKKETPTNFIQLIESLKTLSKVKNTQGVSKPDGIWGSMTTTALNGLYSITSAMFNLMTKLQINSQNYTQADLNEFKSDMTQTNSPKAAAAITKNIAKIKKLVGDFMHAMTVEQGKYSAYVRQEKPFDAGFGNKAEYNAQDKQIFEALRTSASKTLFFMPQDIVGGAGTIPLDVLALASKEGFNKFIMNNRITVNGKDPVQDPAARDELLNYVEQKIKTMGDNKNQMQELPKGY